MIIIYCPICGQNIKQKQKCSRCGYEADKDYEVYPTIAKIKIETKSVNWKRQDYERICKESKRFEEHYQSVKEQMGMARDIPDYEIVIAALGSLKDYKDCNELMIQCEHEIERLKEAKRKEEEAHQAELRNQEESEGVVNEKKEQRVEIYKERYAPKSIRRLNTVDKNYNSQRNNKPKEKKKTGIAMIVAAAVSIGIGIVVAMGNKIFMPKLKDAGIGDVATFGTYEQDNNISNGPEAIEWIVLDEKDGELLLLSKYALDCKPYNDEWGSTTWEKCSLRSWLNTEFMDAFSDEEKNHILDTKVTADKNPKYDTNPGNDTEDKVFLLSIDELEKLFTSNEARQCKPTEYTNEKYVWKGTNGNCVWWLRTPGNYDSHAAEVISVGSVYYDGNSVSYDDVAVRPALWINP